MIFLRVAIIIILIPLSLLGIISTIDLLTELIGGGLTGRDCSIYEGEERLVCNDALGKSRAGFVVLGVPMAIIGDLCLIYLIYFFYKSFLKKK